MKQIITIFCALALLVGCKKVTVDFTYSPTAPKAGETIKFTNNSSAGESWAWTFGDNTTSVTKNPSKVYKKPGEYLVTLMVDSAKYQTRSQLITVYDTIPTFVVSSDSILHYHDVTLKANVYNPFKYELTYQWTLPDNAILVAGNLNSASVEVYFTTAGAAEVGLTILQKDKQYDIERTLTIHPAKAPAIVMRKTDKTVARQRIINDRLEQPANATSQDVHLIEQACDTAITFNGTTFTASQLPAQVAGLADMPVEHLQIDAMQMKWYITTPNGLFVASFDGSNITPIDAEATGAIFVDDTRSRIYWANPSGVFAMPLVKSKNNQFTTTPQQYNELNNIDLIIVNNTPQ